MLLGNAAAPPVSPHYRSRASRALLIYPPAPPTGPERFCVLASKSIFSRKRSSNEGDFFVLFLRKDGLGPRKRVLKTKKISGNYSYSLSSFRWHSF